MCLARLEDGTILSGTAGGGVVEWTPEGEFINVSTTVEGLPSNHIIDITAMGNEALVATRAGLAIRQLDGTWSSLGDGIDGEVRNVTNDGETYLVLTEKGELFRTSYTSVWSPVVLPPSLPSDGWRNADLYGDQLALSNGTDIVLVDLTLGNSRVLTVESVFGLALKDQVLAVGTNIDLIVYDLAEDMWVDVNYTPIWYAEVWRVLTIGSDRIWAASVGYVASLPLPLRLGEMNWTLEARVLVDGGDPVSVFDLLPLTDGRAIIAVPCCGLWSVENGEAVPMETRGLSMPPENDMASVEIAGNVLWTRASYTFHGLSLTSEGDPISWFKGVNSSDYPRYRTIQDSDVYGGVIYFVVGWEEGILTYDTYTSAKPSRWNITHKSQPEVMAVEALGGDLFSGGPFGVLKMVVSGDRSNWLTVEGSPDDVLSLQSHEDRLLVGTEGGLWAYAPSTGNWTSPDQFAWVPEGEVSALTVTSNTAVAAIDGTLYWKDASGSPSKVELSTSDVVMSMSVSPEGAGPVWTVLDGHAVAVNLGQEPVHFRDGEGGEADAVVAMLGDADVRDVVVGPYGLAYLATDSGIHRVSLFESEVSSWTTSNGLSANDIRDLALEPGTDDLWIGAYGGVDVLDTTTGQPERIGTEDGLPSNQVYDIMFHSGEVWIGTDVGGAARRRLPDGMWQIYNATTGLVEDDVQALARLDNKVMFGTDSGITVLDLASSTLSTHTMTSTNGQLPSDWIWCTLATEEDIFAGTDRGLARYDPSQDRWYNIREEGILEDQIVRALATDASGRLWVGAAGGVFVLDGDLSVDLFIDTTDGLPSDNVLSLLLDSQGYMWIGTSRGVAMLDMEGRVHASFSTYDGLVHDTVNSLAEHPSGTLWIGTAGGLSKLEKVQWGVMGQSDHVFEELPDVVVSLAEVVIFPEEPNEGDDVLINVTVGNPTTKRAIATVELSRDEMGEPGDTISDGIAYTEPGDEYVVQLTWTAVGGDHTLWVVADPLDLVPELNERNNIATVSLHVNRGPSLLAVNSTLEGLIGNPWNQVATFALNVMYSDLDGDPPVEMTAYIDGAEPNRTTMFPVVGSGNLVDGMLYRGEATVGKGNWTVVIRANDGGLWESVELSINLNFEVDLVGISDGDGLSGRPTFSIDIGELWEGTSVDLVEARLVEPSTSEPGSQWFDAIPLNVSMIDLDATLDLGDIAPGEYDLYIVVTDDRGVMAVAIVTGVEVKEEGTILTTWFVVAGLIFITLIAIFVTRILWRSGRT